MSIIEYASAKINLSLLITGKWPDGYHTLSSFVTFSEFGDEVHIEPSDHFAFTIEGPFAHQLKADEQNLCVKAYKFVGPPEPVAIKLVKNMPVSSGIGGGSADAAAVIRGLISHFDIKHVREDKLVDLGADVPVCFYGKNCHMSGVGEVIHPLSLPSFHLLLVNPAVSVSTPEVFKKRKGSFSEECDRFPEDLSLLKNDLEVPATALFPVIDDVLQALIKSPDCRLARLSGSGATCFGVYPNAASAKLAEKQIREANPVWWTQVTVTKGS